MKKETVFSCMLMVLLSGCAVKGHLATVQNGHLSVTLAPASDRSFCMRDTGAAVRQRRQDTLVVNFEGRDMFIMKAVRDEKTGEMTAVDELKAAVVTARFRNLAERHGRVDIGFEITVPDGIQDSDWQLRLQPRMIIRGDTTSLDRVLVTGPDYRKAQLRGYQHYERFLSKIIPDTSGFVDTHGLEVFLQRNIPQLYKFRGDTSFVSDEEFASWCGVTEAEAVRHFTMQGRIMANERRKMRREEMYGRFVKAPILSEGVRLDTVLAPGAGDMVYSYVETIDAGPGLRKVEVTVDGSICRQEKVIYDMPATEPLTFYISSVASLVDSTERHITEIRYRRVGTSASCIIGFRAGRCDIDPALADNERQMQGIMAIIDRLMINPVFALDSVMVTAFASPEGSASANRVISLRRGAAVAAYFNRYVSELSDSLRVARGTTVMLGDSPDAAEMPCGAAEVPVIRFSALSGGENWSMLDSLVQSDTVLTQREKKEYASLRYSGKSVDECEELMKKRTFYSYMRQNLYPGLRSVHFRFELHRIGMVCDTVHTDIVDTVYRKGVQAIRDRDYEKALSFLGRYRDFNTAIALLSLDRNVSAMEILRELAPNPSVRYVMALLYSRMGDDAEAVKNYMEACREEPSFVHRGNLDPEISELVRRYGIDDNFNQIEE